MNSAKPIEFPTENCMAKLVSLAADLIEHGHGKITISSTVIKDGKRKVIIEAGKSYVFLVSQNFAKASSIA